jgi:hypothetical protein
MTSPWYVWLNLNPYVLYNIKHKIIGKNIIFIGDDEMIYQTEKITIIGNGKIYNEKYLWEIIQQDRKNDHPLSIIIELYNKFGFEDAIELLEGDFAFMLLDFNILGEESWLYVARDPFGVYPLYQLETSSISQKKVLFELENKQYGFSSIIDNNPEITNMNCKPYVGSTYHLFSHSFKVSATWRLTNGPNKYYKLPFCSTYKYNEKPLKQEKKWIDISIEKRLDWIIYKYGYLNERLNTKIKIGIINIENEHTNFTKNIEENILKKDILEVEYIKNTDIFGNTIAENKVSILLRQIDKLGDEYPNIITTLKQNINSNDPSVIRAHFMPYLIAKYLIENKPEIKHIFITESFTYEWLYTDVLTRRKIINDLYLQEKMRGWTQVFIEFGIHLYMPFLDRILIQNVHYSKQIYLENEQSMSPSTIP